MTFLHNIIMAARIAMRDMRGKPRSLWLLVSGVFIGVAAVALLGATSQSLLDGARKGALESVGGDLSLRLYHRPPNNPELTAIQREGEVTITTELRPMVRALKNGDGAPLLVELKGVDPSYPLYGDVEIQPKGNLSQVLEKSDGVYGAVADAGLFAALGLEPGDQIKIGKARYQLRATLVTEPDRAFRAFTLGPRLIVANASLAATGVANEGAEVYFYTRLKLPPKRNSADDAAAALARIDQAFPDSGWRIVNAHEGVPGVERSLELAHVLLLFIGLGVMLIGGAGISGAVRAHLAEKLVTIAILKSVGARPRVTTMAIGIQVMVAAGVGAILGVALGAVGPALTASALSDQLPFSLTPIPDLKPLFAAGLFGILVAALFAWWPLMEVQNMSPQVLLRNRITQTHAKPTARNWIGTGAILLLLMALVFWVSPMPVLTVGFLTGALLLAGFYYALGIGLSRFARTLARGKGHHFRLPLSNLYRTGAPTGPVVMALGLTLTLLVALDGIGESANKHLRDAVPQSAPDLVAFSLKSPTATRLGAELETSSLLEHQRILPFLHARVQAIGGVAVRDLDIPGSLNWVIRGDRGVSFATKLPDDAKWEGSQIQSPGISIDRSVAEKLGIERGDTLTLNVGGRVLTGEVLNFRNVDWTKLELDFPIIATPALFKDIPHTFAASLKAKPGQQAALEDFIKHRFQEVPLIRVADVLQSLSNALSAIVTGLEATALMCGLAALVVLAGSVLQGLRERTDEAVLFKVLGARRHQLLSQLMVEFLALGIVVALAAVPLGFGVAFGVGRAAGLDALGVSWTGGLILAVAAILITLTVGFAATLSAYTTTPARILRNRDF